MLLLSGNRNLHSLPIELGLCSKIYRLTYDDCPLTWMPQDVVQGGQDCLLEYMAIRGGYGLHRFRSASKSVSSGAKGKL